MHLSKIRLIFLLLTLLSPGWAGAADLTLDQCLERAMRDNPQIMAYQSAVKAAEAGVSEAWGAFLPTLGLTYNKSSLTDSSGKGVNTDYIDQVTDRYSVMLSQSLFAGMSSVAGLKKARENKDYRDRELQFIKAQVRLDVRSRFYDVLMAREQVDKMVEAVKRYEQQVGIAKAWVAQSLAPRIRLLEVQVALSNARQDLIAAETTLKTAQARLEELMAVGHGSSGMDLAGSLEEGGSEACSEFDDCLDLALEQRPELKLMALNIDMARQDAKIITARNLPRASLDVSWNKYKRDYNESLLPDDDREYYSVMLNLSFQPFQGGRTIYAWKGQQAEIERLENLLVKQRNTIVTEVRTRYEQLNQSHGQLVAANDSLTQAREAYKLMSRSVELGVSSLRDLLDSAVLLTRAEINMINSYHALQLARVTLDYVVGY
jgi:outer membrane protein TolC